jgi:hypothetical protein
MSSKTKIGTVKKATKGSSVKAGKNTAKKNTTASQKVKAKPAKKPVWKHDERNPWKREGSAYAVCFNILAAHPDGLSREKLVAHLSKATGKDLIHAGYDAQTVVSAKGNAEGLNHNEGPRHRSAKFGYWVERQNGFVKLMVDGSPSNGNADR